jgi:hypothetical protein
MDTGLNLRPAQAQVQEGDPLHNGRIGPRFLEGLILFPPQPSLRFAAERRRRLGLRLRGGEGLRQAYPMPAPAQCLAEKYLYMACDS